MYTLKGLFPEPKKEPKKNFIKENMKQLKYIQGKSPKGPKFTMKTVQGPRLSHNPLAPIKSSPSSKSGKVTLNVGKTSYSNVRKNSQNMRIKKGDMAEFLKRKEKRQMKQADSAEEENPSEDDNDNEDSSGRCRDIGCQTVESNAKETKLTMLYPVKHEDSDAKLKASGDSGRYSPATPQRHHTPRRVGDSDILEAEKRSKVNAILERKESKDPYLPSGYQKGVLPKYLRARKEAELKEAEGEEARGEEAACPPGHVALPDAERRETLRMFRNSFAEMVSELNKMPVKTDTLRMRSRKMELERQLAKLEEGIKVFTRPRVFVKIGE